MNCGPLSDVMAAGTPNRAIQPETRAVAQSAALVLSMGMASIHLLFLSIMVKM